MRFLKYFKTNNFSSTSLVSLACLVVVLSSSVLASVSFAQDATPESKDLIQERTEQENEAEVETKSESETVKEAKPRSAADHFMRIRKDRKGRPVSLDTSITRYELTNDDGKKSSCRLDRSGAHW